MQFRFGLQLLSTLLFLVFAVFPGCSRKRDLANAVHVAIREKYKSLDPVHGGDFYTDTMIHRSYEGLLEYHYLKRPYELEPLLADGMPIISKDGLTYTFKIRKGVRFQDDRAFKEGRGRELVAEDFVYSFKRLMNPYESADGQWTLSDKLVGLNEWAEKAAKAGKPDFDLPVEGLKAIDRYTLQLKLVRANPILLHLLTMAYTSVVAREVVEHYGKEIVQHPVGTGPFRLDSLTPNQAIWVKNPTFHGQNYPTEGMPGDKEAGLLEDAGKPLPFVDKVVDDTIIEDQPAWLNFMQGNHDYLGRMTKDNQGDIFDSEHKPKRELLDRGIAIHTTPGIWFNYICFNMEDPVVGGEKNKFLRKAMSLALDSGPMIEKFYLGLAKKANGPLVPGLGGYDPTHRNPNREYNLVKARELLAKAGHPNGEGLPELVFETKSDMTFRQIAEYIQRSVAPLGLKMRINVSSWPELVKRIRTKQAQLFYISWVYDYPDAENGWAILYSKNESPGSNEANYKNPKYDELYEKIAVMRDGPERYALFKKMQDIFEEDVPWIPALNQMETRLTHSWVKNFKISAFEFNVEKYLRIDMAARQKELR